jgi:hypothetical protein
MGNEKRCDIAVDKGLAEVFRTALAEIPGVSKRKMMGRTCFMINGHLVGGASRQIR